ASGSTTFHLPISASLRLRSGLAPNLAGNRTPVRGEFMSTFKKQNKTRIIQLSLQHIRTSQSMRATVQVGLHLLAVIKITVYLFRNLSPVAQMSSSLRSSVIPPVTIAFVLPNG